MSGLLYHDIYPIAGLYPHAGKLPSPAMRTPAGAAASDVSVAARDMPLSPTLVRAGGADVTALADRLAALRPAPRPDRAAPTGPPPAFEANILDGLPESMEPPVMPLPKPQFEVGGAGQDRQTGAGAYAPILRERLTAAAEAGPIGATPTEAAPGVSLRI